VGAGELGVRFLELGQLGAGVLGGGVLELGQLGPGFLGRVRDGVLEGAGHPNE